MAWRNGCHHGSGNGFLQGYGDAHQCEPATHDDSRRGKASWVALWEASWISVHFVVDRWNGLGVSVFPTGQLDTPNTVGDMSSAMYSHMGGLVTTRGSWAMNKYRIRPCEGNKRAWCLIRLRADGTESESFGSYTTSHSLDSLLQYAGHLKPQPGDSVEFIPMAGPMYCGG